MAKSEGALGFTGRGKLSFNLFCNKGTTLVGPQMQQNKGWALAPAAFLQHNRQCFGLFP
jgi:hypothetical protein